VTRRPVPAVRAFQFGARVRADRLVVDFQDHRHHAAPRPIPAADSEQFVRGHLEDASAPVASEVAVVGRAVRHRGPWAGRRAVRSPEACRLCSWFT